MRLRKVQGNRVHPAPRVPAMEAAGKRPMQPQQRRGKGRREGNKRAGGRGSIIDVDA